MIILNIIKNNQELSNATSTLPKTNYSLKTKSTYKKLNNNIKVNLSFGAKLRNFVKMIEVEVNKNCNLKCGYCPNSLIKGKEPEQLMQQDLFRKILLDLKEIKYAGKMAFHRYNEPLMANVEEYIKMTKTLVPEITTELFTNGSLLSTKRLQTLHEAGIDKIIVTQHTPKGFIDKLLTIPDRLLKNIDVKYGSELKLSNRAGILSNIKDPVENVSQMTCKRPSNTMIIDVKGNVLICCDDYHRTTQMGNVNDKSIKEIWNSPKYKKIRESIAKGYRHILKLCQKCNRIEENNASANQEYLKLIKATYRKHLLKTTGSAHLPE